VVTWIVIGAVVLGLVVLVAVSLPVVGRLAALQRAAVRLQRRQDEATALQEGAQRLEHNLLGLQRRAETMQERLAVIQAARGGADPGRHARR
jgi:biopolymer transport protein ExbB/TolQ